MRIEVTFRTGNAAGELKKACAMGVFAVAQQALKDCNFYCKQDTSALINSSLIHSEPEKGILRWVTPYADYQYSLPAARKDKNPNASPQWCERAYEAHGDTWQRIMERAVKLYGS